jgi:hypothetical protein
MSDYFLHVTYVTEFHLGGSDCLIIRTIPRSPTFWMTETIVLYHTDCAKSVIFKYHAQVKYTKISEGGTKIYVCMTHVVCPVYVMGQPLLLMYVFM